MSTNGTKKVLLVTPDASQEQALIQQLAERGCPVATAANGAAGLLAAHTERPALIILDAELPVMNGYHMLEALRNDPITQEMTVILRIPLPTESEMTRGWLCGADFCLPRDSSPADLILLVERALLVGSATGYSFAS